MDRTALRSRCMGNPRSVAGQTHLALRERRVHLPTDRAHEGGHEQQHAERGAHVRLFVATSRTTTRSIPSSHRAKNSLVHRSIDLIQNVDQPGIAETLGMGMHLRERPMDRVRRDPKPRRPPRFSSHRHTRGTWARTLNSPATTNDTRAASQLASPGSSWPSCPSVCCSHQRRTCPAAASACPGTTLPRAGSMSASQAAVLSTTSTALE